ncbi:MAG TPA: MBL fold metallo-hydrolase [Acidimicrobiia bacterium]|nr:MBL fold metallo-hydrolase [Acidimicrobiia bacterium]
MSTGSTPDLSVLAVGPFDNRVYILSCPVTKRAVVIDAADEADRIIAACDGLDVQAILTTHGHSDHIQAVDEVKAALDVPFLLHPADRQIAVRTFDGPLKDGDEYPVGTINIHVIHTPGHTPGSVSFVVEPIIFSGDTLFPGGPGATRWEYSSFGQIMDSVEKKLMVYPDPTLVYPGHGAGTTVGQERPHLEEWRKRGW